MVAVDQKLYDAFFNSPVGYRAQYCQGKETGHRADRMILDAVDAALKEFAKNNMETAFDLEKITASLAAKDAKIWIDENEPSSTPPNDFQIHINYEPWVERAMKADVHQEEDLIGAMRGVLAPIGERLEIKGGWIDSSGSEIPDPCKANRSEMIALNGFV